MTPYLAATIIVLSIAQVAMTALTAYSEAHKSRPHLAEAVLFPPLGAVLALLILTAHRGMSLWPFVLIWLSSAALASAIVRKAHAFGRRHRYCEKIMSRRQQRAARRELLRKVSSPTTAVEHPLVGTAR